MPYPLDPREETLLTQSMQACLGAMGAAEVNVYGSEPGQWRGIVIDGKRDFTAHSTWMCENGKRYHYYVHVGIRVSREEMD